MVAPLKVGLAGLGTVGAAVIELIVRERTASAARSRAMRSMTAAPTVPSPASPTLSGATMEWTT